MGLNIRNCNLEFRIGRTKSNIFKKIKIKRN